MVVVVDVVVVVVVAVVAVVAVFLEANGIAVKCWIKPRKLRN